MEIAFIHPTAPDSEGTGASYSATQIVQGLLDRGHEVTVYCNNQEPGRSVPFETELLSYDGGFPRNAWEAINNAINTRASELGSYDIVHSYLMRSIPAVSSLSSKGVETVVTLNAYGGICPKNDLRYFGEAGCRENGLLRCASCTLYEGITESVYDSHDRRSRIARIAYSPFQSMRQYRIIKQSENGSRDISRFHSLADHIKDKYAAFGYERRNIEVIPNILDEAFLGPHTSDFEPPYKLLHVGHLRPHKGVEQLVPLVAELRDRYQRDVSLTVIGEGPSRETMEDQARASGVNRYVDFEGWIDNEELPSWYASHDLFVYPGQWDEPFGRIFLEALAAGTPVVASNVGAVEEIVGDGGVIVDKEEGDLTGAVDSVLERSQLKTLSRKCKVESEQYRRDAIAKRFEAMYRELLRS